VNPDLGIHNSESRIPDLDLVDLSPFEREGFQVIAPAVSGEECEVLASELSSLFDKQKEASTNRVAGVRNLREPLRQSPSRFGQYFLTKILAPTG